MSFVLPKLLVARILLIGLLILFLARVMATGSLTIRRTPLDLPLLAFSSRPWATVQAVAKFSASLVSAPVPLRRASGREMRSQVP